MIIPTMSIGLRCYLYEKQYDVVASKMLTVAIDTTYYDDIQHDRSSQG